MAMNVPTTSFPIEPGGMQRSCLTTTMTNMPVRPKFQELDSQPPTPKSESQATDSYPSEPGPATGGRFFNEDKRSPSIVFKICPEPSQYYTLRCQEWLAFLEVKCSDVPRLMREGFRWDSSNVIREEGYLERGAEGHNVGAWAATPTRFYFLTDTHQPRRWIACIGVKAQNPNTLFNFELNSLSRECIRSVWASNQDGQEIYSYRAYTCANPIFKRAEIPMMGFNMIYDKMPLEGFWPWPRKENDTHIKEDVDEVAGSQL